MKTKAGKLLLAGASFAALALVVALTPTGQAAAQGMMNALMVQVVNTPMVNAQQSGSWNVGINGGVNIANPATNPVLTRDVDSPARQPFSEAFACGVSPGETFCAAAATNFVPPGKLLVVETITAEASAPAGQLLKLRLLRIGTSGFLTNGFLSLTPREDATNVMGKEYVTMANLRFYYSSDTKPGLLLARVGGTADSASLSAGISGYLVDCGAGPGCPIP